MKKIKHILTDGLFLSVLTLALFVGVQTVEAFEPNILIGPDLSLGSTGQNVVTLQGLLSELGYLNVPTGVPLGYYGSLTRGAVGRYQADLNVYPTAGYYGSLTKRAMRSDFERHGWTKLLGWQ